MEEYKYEYNSIKDVYSDTPMSELKKSNGELFYQILESLRDNPAYAQEVIAANGMHDPQVIEYNYWEIETIAAEPATELFTTQEPVEEPKVEVEVKKEPKPVVKPVETLERRRRLISITFDDRGNEVETITYE